MATKEVILEDAEDEVEDGEEWPETSDVKTINFIVQRLYLLPCKG